MLMLWLNFNAATTASTLLHAIYGLEDPVIEYSYAHEYPGREEDVPPTYFLGRFSHSNMVEFRSLKPLMEIPGIPNTNLVGYLLAKHDNTYWHIDVTKHTYDKRIWTDVGLPNESNNRILKQYLAARTRLHWNLLNLGLEHSIDGCCASNSGHYLSESGTLDVEYRVSQTNSFSLPSVISVELSSRNATIPPLEWIIEIAYDEDRTVNSKPAPKTITRYRARNGEKIRLIDRMRIQSLSVNNTQALPTTFLLPHWGNSVEFPNAYIGFVQGERIATVTADGGVTFRLEPDDPRILGSRERKLWIVGFWIATGSVVGFACVSFFLYQRKLKQSS